MGAGNPALGIGGWFQVSVTAAHGHTIDELAPVVQQILDDVKKNGVTLDEIERARRNLIADKLRSVERIGGFGGKADLLNLYQTFLGDPGYLPRDLARYRAVTPEAVKAFANKYLADDRRIELDIIPRKKTATAAAGGAK